jgi:hypothetical protein
VPGARDRQDQRQGDAESGPVHGMRVIVERRV